MSVISKKTALITGCSDGGLGAAVAKVLCKKDYHVFATLRDTSKAGALAALGNVEVLELEVTSEESIARCAEHVRAKTGGTLDVLVNNAGRDFIMPLLDADLREAKKLFDVNFWGVLAVTQAFAPLVVEAKGVVANHSSVVWNLAIAWGGLYNTSKAAVKQISEVMRVELEPLGVRVVTVIVGGVDTPIVANSTRDAFQMPADSYYEPVRRFIVDARDGKLLPQGQPVDVTARGIVDDILGGASGCTWRGVMSSRARWLSWLLPIWALDWINNGSRGVSELRSYYLTKGS
ncbi:hypothetical protein M426DRAFT_164934 [Hypoxylon sp. CI-4A]|nr:hypothetical protein M426DRAFT_164934 [Hypoxylon sp. CI-4A]